MYFCYSIFFYFSFNKVLTIIPSLFHPFNAKRHLPNRPSIFSQSHSKIHSHLSPDQSKSNNTKITITEQSANNCVNKISCHLDVVPCGRLFDFITLTFPLHCLSIPSIIARFLPPLSSQYCSGLRKCRREGIGSRIC